MLQIITYQFIYCTLLSRSIGDFDEAQSCFKRSLAELAAIDNMVEHVRSQEAYGLFYMAHKQEDDAERGQALIDSPRATFQRLGVNG
jgi:hypothetical protein